MPYSRNIKFNYYQIINNSISDELDKNYFSATEWKKTLDDNQLIKKHIDLSKCKAKIEYIEYSKLSGLWKIRLMRLGEYNIPQKSKTEHNAEDIPMDDDEYIGYDVNILYDEMTGIAMIQRNKMSLTIERITELIHATNPSNNKYISILPILKMTNGKKLTKNGKKIELTFANIVNEIPETLSPLSSIINSFHKLRGLAGNVAIGVGRGKEITTTKSKGKEKKTKTERFLDARETAQFINDIRDNSEIISRGIVTLRDEDDTNVQLVDLFDDVFVDIIKFQLESRKTLGIGYVMDEMRTRYDKRKSTLIKSLKNED